METLLQALLYIAEKSKIRLAIDPDDGNIYEVGEEGEGLTRLHPITDPSQTVAVYDVKRLITLHNTTALQQYCNGNLSELQQAVIGRETAIQRNANGNTTGEQRIANGFATDTERELIGAGKVNLPPFSTNCPPEVEGVARNIEKLLRRAIANTNKPATLENLMQYHRDAAKYAAVGNIFKLNQIEGRVRGIVAKQGAIKSSEQTIARRHRRRLLLRKIAAAVVFAAALGGWGWWKFTSPTNNAPLPITADSSPTLPASKTNALAAAFAEYEEATGKRIYPAGRRCIENAAAAAGIENDKQAIKELINKNIKL